MPRGKRLVLLLIVCVVFCGTAIFRWNAARTASSEQDSADYAKLIAQAASSGQPAVVFFTTSRGCCASKLELLLQVEATVEEVTDEFEGQISYISIDIGDLSQEVTKQITEIADRYGIRVIPTVLVLDSAGQHQGTFSGVIDPVQLLEQLRQLVVR